MEWVLSTAPVTGFQEFPEKTIPVTASHTVRNVIIDLAYFQNDRLHHVNGVWGFSCYRNGLRISFEKSYESS